MATLIFILILLVAVALVGASLRALVVAFEAMCLTYRLKLAARIPPDAAARQKVSGPLPPLHSCYPPIRVLYSTRRNTPD